MSTRMSDWSANPLIALFFAVELDATAEACPLVYQYPIELGTIEREKEVSPLKIPHTRIIQVNHSHRSAAQAAWQVVHAIHKKEGCAPEFIQLGHMPPHKESISEICVSKQYVPAIRIELSKMGMMPSTIYGDFGSVCRSIGPLLVSLRFCIGSWLSVLSKLSVTRSWLVMAAFIA